MNKWSNTPNEVLDIIFKLLEKRELIQCSLTCTSWLTTAQSILFEQIYRTSDNNINNLKKALFVYKSNNPFNSYKQSPANHTKSICCYHLSDDFDVDVLDKLFPNLQYINIDITQQLIYMKICQSIKEGRFFKLKRIPHLHLNEAHVDFLLAYGTHIQELSLAETYFDSGSFKLFDNLHLFTKLKSIRFHCDTDRTVCLERLLSKSPSMLRSIDFNFYHSSRLTLNTSLHSLDTMQPLTSMREIHLSDINSLFFSGNESYLYVMNKFPTVEEVQLCFATEEALKSQNYRLPSLSCLTEFVIYLFKRKQMSSVRPIITDEHTTEVIKSFFRYALTQRTIKEVKIHLTVSFKEVHQWEKDSYPQERTAYISMHNHYCDYWKICDLEVTYKIVPGSNLQPYLDLFEKVGSYVDYLTIDRKLELQYKLPFSLDVVFYHFLNLKKLCIVSIHNITFREKKTSLTETNLLLNLKYLEIQMCTVPEWIFPVISRQCPNLKSLKLIINEFVDWNRCYNRNIYGYHNDYEYQPKHSSRIISINMPSTRLHSLHMYISLKECDSDECKYDKAFLRLSTADRKTRYCKIVSNYEDAEPIDNSFFYEDYTEKDYKICVDDETCILHDIYCNSVVQLTVDANVVDDKYNYYKRDYFEEDRK